MESNNLHELLTIIKHVDFCLDIWLFLCFFFTSSEEEIILPLTMKLELALEFIKMCQVCETIQRHSLSLREQKNFVMLFECYIKPDHCLRILFIMSIWFRTLGTSFAFDLSHLCKACHFFLFYFLWFHWIPVHQICLAKFLVEF